MFGVQTGDFNKNRILLPPISSPKLIIHYYSLWAIGHQLI
jgi:hypothetical protein